jgi:hypothetical protein
MDDYLSLRMLQLHLPDPDQDLFVERWRNTNTFHGFSKLPIELRRMIWRFTFREFCIVNLNPVVELDIAQNGEWFSHHRRKQNPLPVALYVNTESRAEATRFYCVYHREAPLDTADYLSLGSSTLPGMLFI